MLLTSKWHPEIFLKNLLNYLNIFSITSIVGGPILFSQKFNDIRLGGDVCE